MLTRQYLYVTLIRQYVSLRTINELWFSNKFLIIILANHYCILAFWYDIEAVTFHNLYKITAVQFLFYV